MRTAQAIAAGFRGQTRITRARLLLDGTVAGTLKFTSANSYWKTTKPQLKKETGGKCAYCEAPTDVNSHGDVEHFRPKSVYWWLAYCYDNYLYSCQVCNQIYKGDNFPVHGTTMRIDPPLPDPFPSGLSESQRSALAARLAPDPLNDGEGYPMARFLQAVNREKAGLPDPYVLDPQRFFKWEVDSVLKEVSLAPRNNLVATKRAFAAAMTYLGLNREELKRVRWQHYLTLDVARTAFNATLAHSAERQTVVDALKEMLSDGWPFAAMNRYFVKDVWQLDLT
jgi:hypothetical protein